jgi:hypothetical protein
MEDDNQNESSVNSHDAHECVTRETRIANSTKRFKIKRKDGQIPELFHRLGG